MPVKKVPAKEAPLRNTPAIGTKAPPFRLPDADGKLHALSSHAGRKVVVYFYPKDDTPGCTTQACDFRDNIARLSSSGVDVIGISADSGASHAKFRDKYGLPFTLLSDLDRSVMTAYGAFGEKTLYGKKITGVLRSTYLVDEKGRIAAAWPNVRAKGHVDAVLRMLESQSEDVSAR